MTDKIYLGGPTRGQQDRTMSKAAVDKMLQKRKYTKTYYTRMKKTWEGKIEYLWNAAKQRAKTIGMPFDLDLEELQKTDKICPVFGVDMNLVRPGDGRKDYSPSLDRIDNSKGYTKDNVRVICWKANNLKSNGTIEEFEKILEYMRGRSV